MGNEKLTAEQIMKAARTMAGALIGIEGVLRVLVEEAEKCEECYHANPDGKCEVDCPRFPIRKVIDEVQAEPPKERSAGEVLAEMQKSIEYWSRGENTDLGRLIVEAQAAVARLEAENAKLRMVNEKFESGQVIKVSAQMSADEFQIRMDLIGRLIGLCPMCGGEWKFRIDQDGKVTCIDYEVKEAPDWTTDPATGRAYSSREFKAAVEEVRKIIFNSASALLGGHAEEVARTIIIHLASFFGLAPRKKGA